MNINRLPSQWVGRIVFEAPKFDVVEGDCWVWTGAMNGRYGKVRVGRSTQQAHRAVYTWLVGPIGKGLELDHVCLNQPCVNPDHLEPVTPRENMERAMRARRAAELRAVKA